MKIPTILAISPERHTTENWLRDVILGGQDGLVNVLGIVLGVTAASGGSHIIIAASLAAAFAEAVSMGAVAYTSTLAERDHYLKELERENYEVDTIPDKEKAEVREIYAAKGFSGKLLEDIVQKLTSDKNIWISTMMREELGLKEVDTSSVIRSSLVVGVAALLGSFVPIFPYFFLAPTAAMPIALFVSATALFSVGVYEAKSFVGLWWQNGSRMVLIGLGAAAAGYFIGKFLGIQ